MSMSPRVPRNVSVTSLTSSASGGSPRPVRCEDVIVPLGQHSIQRVARQDPFGRTGSGRGGPASPLSRPRGATCRRLAHPRSLRLCGTAGGGAPGRCSPSSRRAPCLAREGLPRCSSSGFPFQRAANRAGPGARWPLAATPGSTACVLRALLRSSFCARRRTRELHAGPARLREPDGDRLLGRARAVLAPSDVLHLLVHELTGLRGRCLAPAFRLTSTFTCLLLRHTLVHLWSVIDRRSGSASVRDGPSVPIRNFRAASRLRVERPPHEYADAAYLESSRTRGLTPF
jgi:hypothetical protein